MYQRLKNIRESLDALLAAHEDDTERLGAIQMAYQLLDQLETVAPDEVDTQMLGVLEGFVHGLNASNAGASIDYMTMHEEGVAFFRKFQRWGNLNDLEKAIASWQHVVDMIPDNDHHFPGHLSNLGVALFRRFERVGIPADLEAAVSQHQKAVNLTPDDHPNKPSCLSNLGNALETRFNRHGSLADLEEAILQNRKAVDLTPDNHPDKPGWLNNLGSSLGTRFDRHGSLADLEEAILHNQKAVDLTPDDDPSKPGRLSNLGNVLRTRFDRHGSLADLEEAILHKRKAIDLTPDDHPDKSAYLNNLGKALETRFNRHGSLANLEEAILQNRKAVDLTPDDHTDKPVYLNNLGNVLGTRFDKHGSLADLEEAISQHQKAVNLTSDDHPDKPVYLNNLGNSLGTRFDRHGSLADLEEAILQNQKAVDLIPDDHPSKPGYLNNLGNVLGTRFDQRGSLADLEGAISQRRKAVDLTPDDHPNKPGYLNNLGSSLGTRFSRHGSLADLEEAILHKRKAVDLTPDDHPRKPNRLSNLGNALETRFDRHGSLTDLEEAILQKRKAVELTHSGEPAYLINLGISLSKRFNRHGSLADLDEAILQEQKAADLIPNGRPDRAPCLSNLSRVLRIRFERLGDRNDLQNALLAAQESAESPAASSKLRLKGALLWAHCCNLGSTSPFPAFKCAITLLPRIAWPGLAVDDQYFLLAEAGSTVRAAVEAAIAEGEDAIAIEWAEQGRSIVWQNLLGLRTPLDSLQSRHPDLAMRLQELSQHLEQSLQDQNGVNEPSSSGMASNQMALALERDELIDKIRSKPGFESFMKPKPLEELAPATRDGPVVVLNLGKARCDALALLSDDHGAVDVVPIPLERVTIQSAEQLSKQLVDLLSSARIRVRDSRKPKIHGASDDKNAIFKAILRTLWLDYVRPILDGLAYQVNLGSPPRLWWCTTGPLAFLPLHAAGLYDVKEAGYKVSDYIVSSYIPTLTALLHKSSPAMFKQPKFLTVAISNTPGAPLPCTEEEASSLQRLAANIPVVSLTNEEAMNKRVLEELKESTWAHLACHGEQVGGKPMESGLLLYDGKLKLSDFVRARLPNAEFAFLSACQTAMGDGGVPEESAHLAAGMLFAGYRGVVATMWSIQDDIAPRVSEDFYRYLFRNGQPKREEAAYGLHRAVRSLQESGVAFTSWVPFIHIGH